MKKAFSLIFLFLPLLSHCQIKLAYDKSKLVNGTGTAALVSNKGKNFGFVTYRDNHLDGEFYLIDTLEEYAFRGVLRYDTACVNHTPGFKVKYLSNSDTLTAVLDSVLFTEIFKYGVEKVISTERTLVSEDFYSSSQPELNIGSFGDPAIVPIGKWQRFNLNRGFIFTEYTFDDCGNILLSRYFNPDGSLIIEHKYKPRPKKKKFWNVNENYEQD